jgi:hypothetical protein
MLARSAAPVEWFGAQPAVSRAVSMSSQTMLLTVWSASVTPVNTRVMGVKQWSNGVVE